MKKVLFVTGASGSGKTTALEVLDKDRAGKVKILFFDSIGVPSPEEMIEKFGSSENWQKAMTEEWVHKIQKDHVSDQVVILDGQMKLSFINDACAKYGLTGYQIILFDCNDEVRKARLIGRGQPELANKDMMDWASHLRNSVNEVPNATILDNSDLTIVSTVDKLKILLTPTAA